MKKNKEEIINRIESTINVLKNLIYTCPDFTETLEEQIAHLEITIDCINLWREVVDYKIGN